MKRVLFRHPFIVLKVSYLSRITFKRQTPPARMERIAAITQPAPITKPSEALILLAPRNDGTARKIKTTAMTNKPARTRLMIFANFAKKFFFKMIATTSHNKTAKQTTIKIQPINGKTAPLTPSSPNKILIPEYSRLNEPIL